VSNTLTYQRHAKSNYKQEVNQLTSCKKTVQHNSNM